MQKIFFSFLILIGSLGCFTIGKVGYIVPAQNDSAKLSEEIVGESCAFVVTNILNDLNADLVKKGKADLSNIGLGITSSNCAQARGIK